MRRSWRTTLFCRNADVKSCFLHANLVRPEGKLRFVSSYLSQKDMPGSDLSRSKGLPRDLIVRNEGDKLEDSLDYLTSLNVECVKRAKRIRMRLCGSEVRRWRECEVAIKRQDNGADCDSHIITSAYIAIPAAVVCEPNSQSLVLQSDRIKAKWRTARRLSQQNSM